MHAPIFALLSLSAGAFAAPRGGNDACPTDPAAAIEVLFRSTELSVPTPEFAVGVGWNPATTFSNLTIDDLGRVAFVGRLIDLDPKADPAIVPGGSGVLGNDRCLFYGAPGAWQKVVQGGEPDPLPGGPAGFTFNSATGTNGINTSSVAISPNGRIVVSGTINFPGSSSANDSAMWSGFPESMSFVVQKGSQAGSEKGEVFYSSSLSIAFPRLNNAGRYLFHSNLTGGDVVPPNAAGGVTGTNMGVFLAGPDGVATIARRGFPAPEHPGLPEGTILNTQDSSGFFLNGPGDVVYLTRLANDQQPGAITTADDRAIVFKPANGPLSIMFRENDPVPGMPGVRWAPIASGAPFTMSPQGFDNAGRLLFSATFDGKGITSANNVAVFVRQPDGALSMVIRKGDPVPGHPEETFNFFNTSAFLMNNAGFFVGAASITAPSTASDECLLAGPVGGPLEAIIREGEPIPGLEGVFLGGPFISNTSLIINDRNEVVFRAPLTGPGTTSADNQALFAWDPTRGLRVLLRTGCTEVLDGPAITNIAMAAAVRNAEGGSTALSATGWVALNLSYAGGAALVRMHLSGGDGTCVGDTNGDGIVDGSDLATILAGWGTDDPVADLDGDGLVDGADLTILLAAWGPCP